MAGLDEGSIKDLEYRLKRIMFFNDFVDPICEGIKVVFLQEKVHVLTYRGCLLQRLLSWFCLRFSRRSFCIRIFLRACLGFNRFINLTLLFLLALALFLSSVSCLSLVCRRFSRVFAGYGRSLFAFFFDLILRAGDLWL